MTDGRDYRSVGVVNVECGRNLVVVEPSNVYDCFIGDDVFIGPFVEIQKGVVVGDRARIQSHSFICEMVTIGDDCFIGHGVMFINDLFHNDGPARGDRKFWRATHIGSSVSIGSNATIMPVNICPGALIGAGSVVTRDISEPGVYAGNPARKISNKRKIVGQN